MTDRGADLEAELLEEIERQWAAADRARGRVIRPALSESVGAPSDPARTAD